MELPDCIGSAYYDPEIEEPAPEPQHPHRDLRPEYIRYRDDGCDLAPRCLSCPLPKCRHDDPGWLRRKTRKRKANTIAEAWRKEGLKPKALVARFGVSRRTVHRILKEAREAYPSANPGPAKEDRFECHAEAPRGIPSARPPTSPDLRKPHSVAGGGGGGPAQSPRSYKGSEGSPKLAPQNRNSIKAT